MAVQIIYKSSGRGNTVPYPPLVDDIRRNAGFVDLRSDPAGVLDLAEAQRSPALARLLHRLAQANSPVLSLGCDLGEHREREGRLDCRCVAGGYVQIADARLEDCDPSFLKSVAGVLEEGLRQDVGNDRWKIEFDLAPVAFEFDCRVEAHSIWVWFFAKAIVFDKASHSRERLLDSLSGSFVRFAGGPMR